MSTVRLELRHGQVNVCAPAGGDDSIPVATAGLTELLAGAAQGDPDCWAEIVDRFTSLLGAIARSHRLNQDDAADVAQNTWLRLLENLERIENPEALPGWLATTARREALNVLRRQCRSLPVDEHCLSIIASDAPEVGLALLNGERDARLQACLRKLPDRDQELLRVLFACDRPSYTAIGRALDMSIGSIGPTRMRALKRLHSLLETSGYVFREGPTRTAPRARAL